MTARSGFNVISLYSKGSLIVLESLSFTKTLYAFDFDGTLAKIVSVPSEAYMSPKTVQLMRQLCELVPVAIVSGRSIADLKKRIPFEPKFLIGNHGLEGLGVAPMSMLAASQICANWKQKLNRENFGAGVEIEDKQYSLAIHYRRSREKKTTKLRIERAIGKLDPVPRIIGGKSVFNLLPAGAPHKGAAILDLVQKAGMKHIFYIGDDDTDEDIFGIPYKFGQIMSVRIGRKQTSKASYFLKRQSDINKLLKLIIGHHRPSRHAPRELDHEAT